MSARSSGQPKPRCYQGVIPAFIATCALDGTPNITYLSQVVWLDESHVALSCQFFNKTKQNVLENPYACVELYDPLTFECYRLELHYERSETSGPLFDSMALRIQAIASHTGMSGVFRLISADIYEVQSREQRTEYLLPAFDPAAAELPADVRSELRALHLVSQVAVRARSLEELLASSLRALEEALGFQHSMILLPDESGDKLIALESRGYAELGVGAEVMLGEGLIGTAARERRALRVSGVDAELRYSRAIRANVEQTRARRELSAQIPLPGLPDAQSQLVLPLVVSDRLLGVLAIESRSRLGMDEWDDTFLEVVANQIAVALDNANMREVNETAAENAALRGAPAAVANEPVAAPAPGAKKSPSTTRRFRFFAHDDCVFVDDEYLIRNVPGRILWKILRAHRDTGRTEFSNRELRLDPWLRLPALRDNLESRLVLLRKRLEQKCPELRLISTGRGQFRLEASCTLSLEETDTTEA